MSDKPPQTESEQPPGVEKGQERRARNIFSRGHGVSKSQLAELTARFPGWEFKYGEGALHPHPVGAAERAITEQMLYGEIVRKYGDKVKITDIGGNANRHLRSGRTNVHSCNPVLSASDVIRRRPDSYLEGADYCTKIAEKCQFRPDVYLAVHSLYYMSPANILYLVGRSLKGRLYAVCHSFEKLYGGFHYVDDVAESTYQVFAEGDDMRVHMKVNGNHTGYSHSACTWLRESNYLQIGDEAMAWSSQPVGDSHLYEFSVAPLGLDRENHRDLPLCESLNRCDHHGSVGGVIAHGDQSEFRPMLEELKINTGRVVSYGQWTATFFASQRTILVPKDLIVKVGNSMVGMPRTERTLTTCINRMRTHLNKMNVPEAMKSDCLTYGSSLAFVYSLKDEIHAFNSLCRSPVSRLFASLSRALSMSPLGCCDVAADVAPSDRRARERIGKDLAALYSRDYVTPAIAGSFNAREAWPDGLPGVECNMEKKPLKTGARIKETPANEPDVIRPQLQVNCPIFTPIQAVVPNPSKNNEELALRNRALVDTPAEDTAMWNLVIRHAHRATRGLERIDVQFDELFMTWNAKFPVEVQKRYLLAYANVRQQGLTPKDLMLKMFIKREVTLKTGDVFEDFDPRAIQGCSDEMNVAYGPFIWAASKKLCSTWNPKERICYTSGLTAEDIGAWRATFDGESSTTIVELDESRYDAHQGIGVAACSYVLKQALGIENYHLPAFIETEMMVKRGSSKYFKYRVPGTMTSGKADTSLSNSFVNAMKLDYLLRKFGILEKEIRMLVNGDDSLVVIKRAMTAARTEKLRTFLVEENLKLGFRTKCKIRTEWHEVEYCSGLFWPVEDGYVLGPKIGRRLPKLGFGVTKLTDAQIRSMVIGMKNDLSHVPVLRVYFEYCMKLVRKNKNQEKANKANKTSDLRVKNATYVDKEAPYKNLCSQVHSATAETEEFFTRRYGFSLRLCEDAMRLSLDQIKTITDCVHYPLMKAFTQDL
jgi:hypothetical protein